MSDFLPWLSTPYDPDQAMIIKGGRGLAPDGSVKCAPKVGHLSNSWGFFMSKYTTQFKLSAITAFLERGRGFRRIAAQFQMDPTLLRRWVEAYRLHGEASLSSAGGRYSALFKFSVLQRMWRDSLSLRRAAALFNLGDSTQVGRWQQQYYSGGIEALASGKKGLNTAMPKPPAKLRKSAAPLTKEELAHKALLDELQYLRMENAYLKKLGELGEAVIRRENEAKKKLE